MAKKTISRRKSQPPAPNAKPGRTHSGEAGSEAWTSAVSDADGLLAVVRGTSHVRIIDMHTGALRAEHAFASAVHAVAWGRAATPLVAAALHSGSVAVYSPARNAVVATLAQAAVDVALCGDHVFTLDAAGAVAQWHEARCVRRVATGLAGAQKLLVSRDGARVVVASHRAEVWDVASESRVAVLGSGHAAPVHSLCWALGDESSVATGASGDRTVLVWDVADAPEPRAVLTADADVVGVDVGSDGSVVAVAGDGSACVWFAPHGGDVGRRPDSVIRITGGVRLARLSRVAGDEARCLLVRGSPMAPLCEAVALADRGGRFEAEVDLHRDPDQSINAPPQQQQQQQAHHHPYSEAEATVGAKTEPATPSLADRMGQLSVVSPTTESLRLPAGTLVRVLVQSLHTGDARLLDSVLDNSSRALVVRDTVLQLPPAYVLSFLQQLLARFQTTPSRAMRLLPWIRNTLAMHSAYLLAVPSLVPQLAGFCQAIGARLESHQKLLRLGGRLELAAANFKANEARSKQVDAVVSRDMIPINVYREEEESEDDESMTPTPVWQAEESTDNEGDEGEESEDEDSEMDSASSDNDDEDEDDDDDDEEEEEEEEGSSDDL
ncbi:Small subunit (SSU) processome component [Coemansia sp. BCRC 34301]|nr:Small subunit (SSU) processome component [Coemansia sp. BCRC 34301]